MNIPPEIQAKIDLLQSRMIYIRRISKHRAVTFASLLHRIKRTNYACLKTDGIKRIGKLLDSMLRDSTAA